MGVVLQYRSPEKDSLGWPCFSGGHIEEGESLVESVIREVYEETGLTIADPKLVALKTGSQMREAAILSLLQSDRILQASSDHLKKEKFLGLRRTN